MGEDPSRSRNRSILTNLALIRNGLLRVLNRCFPGDSILVIRERSKPNPPLYSEPSKPELVKTKGPAIPTYRLNSRFVSNEEHCKISIFSCSFQ